MTKHRLFIESITPRDTPMARGCCPWCDLPFPFDVSTDHRVTSYCDSLKHWHYAGIDMDRCADNIIYLVNTFTPITPGERAIDAHFRRMLAWLEVRPW
jgi:hypothetical protein